MGKITLTNIAEELAVRSGLSKEAADNFVRAFVATIEKGLDADHLVKIKGLGTFKLMDMNDRSSVDVNSGERITIKGYTKVSFTPDSSMKEFINRPFAHFEPTELNEGYPDEEPVEEPEDIQADSEEQPETPQEVLEETIETTIEPAADESVEEVAQEIAEQEVEEVVEEATETTIEAIVEESPEATIEEALDPVAEEASADVPTTDTPSEQPAEEVCAEAKPEEDTCEASQPIEEESVAPSNTPVEEEQKVQEVQPAPEAAPQKRHTRRGGWLLALLLIALAGGAYYYMSVNDIVNQDSKVEIDEHSPIAVNPNLGEKLGVELGDTLVEDSTSVSVDSSQVELDSVVAVEPVDTTEVPTSTIVEAEAEPSPMPEVKERKPVSPAIPSTFVIVESLASKNLKNITVADTTDYLITGTQATHKLRDGETIIILARKYYGDKRLWPYIVKHNNITSFNKVAIGMKINIPILEVK